MDKIDKYLNEQEFVGVCVSETWEFNIKDK